VDRVPLVHGRTIYGVLGLYTERETVPERAAQPLNAVGGVLTAPDTGLSTPPADLI